MYEKYKPHVVGGLLAGLIVLPGVVAWAYTERTEEYVVFEELAPGGQITKTRDRENPRVPAGVLFGVQVSCLIGSVACAIGLTAAAVNEVS